MASHKTFPAAVVEKLAASGVIAVIWKPVFEIVFAKQIARLPPMLDELSWVFTKGVTPAGYGQP